MLPLATSSQLADVSYFIDRDNQRDAHKTNTDTCQKSVYENVCKRTRTFSETLCFMTFISLSFTHPPTRIVYLNFDCEPILPDNQGNSLLTITLARRTIAS